MSTAEGAAGPREEEEEEEEEEYGRAAKRLKTEERDEREEGEEELEEGEEGEDSDTGSLPGNGESAAAEDNRARWSSGSGSSQYGAGRKDNGEDSHRISPSPVVHVRGLCEAVVEADLIDALEKFGSICYVMMMPFKRQALVEFSAGESADRCVSCGAKEPVYIAGQQAYFNYSTSKRITRPTNADNPNSGNKVLLLSIQNPLYPITTDVLYTVCNPIGSVLRIVIFKRNGIQAMVEYPYCVCGNCVFTFCVDLFESVQCAQKAKAALNGADIYAGCCTLKIEYARPTRLNVIKNDNESWDYTKPYLVRRGGVVYTGAYVKFLPPLPTEFVVQLKSQLKWFVPLIRKPSGRMSLELFHVFKSTLGVYPKADPELAIGITWLHLAADRGKGRQRQAILGEHPSSYSENGYGSPCPLLPLPSNSRYKLTSVDVPDMVSYPLPQSSSSYSGHAPSSVAMVSGLHPSKMNCTRIFNLFCLYGNIEKVKFMKSVPGTALVEMGDEYAVDRAITHLNSIKVFGKRLNVCVSKQHAVIPSQVFELEDGSSSYKDFAMTRNNRFSSAGQASKNIIQPPSAVLHYYNVPPCISQEQLLRLCTEHDVPGFVKFKMFDAKPSSKTISGLLEFDNKTEAVEVLTVLNHYQIRIPNGSNPYTLKLCFSTSSHL
ncbi:putative heterogeneous nuclear ribonucleoprotein L-like [Scophthalmus maximus]|uniref:Putative heterogeneous nuclear ribonucleoprotein L-like n=1 Tax=Scophthalmus maximus TaxID=52904 RepID=A0A2U9CD42_SCOMX|nr:putative heterogeneous nuclear ribonucleoprotein L-like [Scophthalmus maximus]